MKTENKPLLVAIGALILTAILSLTVIAGIMTSPKHYEHTIQSLDEKKATVLTLSASAYAASTAITLIPGDAATPVANELADIGSYFLIVICAIYLEKYLLTIAASAAFRLLIPVGCLLMAAYLYFGKKYLSQLALKLILFGLALAFVVPVSVHLSDKIEATYEDSITRTMDAAAGVELLAEPEEEPAAEAPVSTAPAEEGGLFGFLNGFRDTVTTVAEDVAHTVTAAATESVEVFERLLNSLIEAFAVMIVTSCLIPIFVLLFFVWLIRVLLGIEINLPTRNPFAARRKDPLELSADN